MKFNPKEELCGARLVLRRPEATWAFAEKMFRVIDHNREHILPWLDWALPEKTKSAEDDFIFAWEALKDWEAGERFEYSVYEKSSRAFLGGLGVMKRGREADKCFEIGYWLAKEACGKGMMQEAVRLVEEEFFSLGVERLIIRNDVKNVKSRQVAQNLGYFFEGVQRNGRYSEALETFVDVNVFSKLRQDYYGDV